MIKEFFMLETRSNAEGAVYEPYYHRRGMLACYGNYGTACDAAYKLIERFDCVRIVRNDGVIMLEKKKWRFDG